MYEISVITSFCILILGTIWYSYLIIKDRINPPVGTFMIASAVFACSFAMYMQNPQWSFSANIALLGALVSAWGVLIVLTVKLLKEKRFGIEFTSFQKWTVFISSLVLLFWYLTENHLASYTLLQLAALICLHTSDTEVVGSKEESRIYSILGLTFSIYLRSFIRSIRETRYRILDIYCEGYPCIRNSFISFDSLANKIRIIILILKLKK